MPEARPAPAPVPLWPWVVAALLLGALALITPINHDEDQYVAAAWAQARGYRPFGDFMYLQTPLQPWLTGPIAAATEGWSFVALRLLNAAAGLVTLGFVYLRLLEFRYIKGPWALATTALLASCVPFLFGASLARNDALPAMLLAIALFGTTDDRWRDWGWAGLGIGLAASLKISYGLPLAAAGFWLLFLWARAPSRGGAAAVVAYGVGGLIGLAPTALTWWAHPAQFEYGVFTYAAEGAKIWYDLNGIGGKLSFGGRARDSLIALMMGPALVALLIVTVGRSAANTLPDTKGVATVLTAAGLVAALLPTPTYRQYFLVMLPPLFVLLGLARLTWWSTPWKRWPLFVLGAASFAIYAGLGVADWVRHGTPAAVRVVQQAEWIGDTMRAARMTGPIVTFTPRYVVDSGIALDLRFTTDVHVWRSADLRSDAEQRVFNVTSRRTLARELDRLPPQAIFTGFERESGVNRLIIPDDALDGWARSRGYTRVPSPHGGQLWLRQRA